MGADDGLETVFFASPAEWEEWLEQNHESAAGVWIKMAKKASGIESVRHEEAVDAALCFGWIDGRRVRAAGEKPLIEVTPRRRGTPWSARDRGRVLRLIETGQMMPAGLEAVESARADGSWTAADSEALRR